MRGAGRDARAGDLQSVCLSSPTGSGKTVMLTNAIEFLVRGDDEHGPIPDATFLWITDQPELNEQTYRKMLSTSSVLNGDLLHVIDASFDYETLRPGAVHFLNTQKLAKGSGLVTAGDNRTFTIWDVVKNTIDAYPGKFFVIIDEAHRGMGEGRSQTEANTIIQKFIKGSSGEIPPVPIVIGISATPERFNRLITGAGRMHRPVEVDVAEVRLSGLIKKVILLHHPKREQANDMTLLREAARSLKDFTSRWSRYCAKQDVSDVLPLLVVQVEDARNKSQASETDIAQAMRVVRDVFGSLPGDAFAHSFQESTKLKIDGEELRYLAPPDVQNDQDARVVFFKTALNTGWDCPRAEVMMSFRTAADSTYIAQLVGRMVRTPLAREIIDDEILDTVTLFLPHYDSKGLKKVVEKLTTSDDDPVAPVDLEEADDIAELNKAPNTEKLFEALSKIPSYVVPRRRKVSQIRRLMKLARLLTYDEIDEDAIASAEKTMIGALNKEFTRLKKDKRFKAIVEERGQIEIAEVNWEVFTDIFREGKGKTVSIASENVEDLFEFCGRRLNEGIHVKWWRQRVKGEPPSARERAKLELFALCIDSDVIANLEKVAQEQVGSWLGDYAGEVEKLDEQGVLAYEEVRNQASVSELVPLHYSSTIFARKGDDTWKNHLYVNEDGVFHADFDTPEEAVLKKEIPRKEIVGWLRNMDRKKWALCVNYEVDGEERPMYPDFLFLRQEKGRLVVDIIDPHSIHLADAPVKAAGLAKFAAKHASKFGRIELILLDGKKSKLLDLKNESVRNKVRAAKIIEQLRAFFD
ncbi:MAG: DEAD/DEAH box helicase family protein [Pirellulales bacterium]